MVVRAIAGSSGQHTTQDTKRTKNSLAVQSVVARAIMIALKINSAVRAG